MIMKNKKINSDLFKLSTTQLGFLKRIMAHGLNLNVLTN